MKKIISLIFCIILSTTLFSGCYSKKDVEIVEVSPLWEDASTAEEETEAIVIIDEMTQVQSRIDRYTAFYDTSASEEENVDEESSEYENAVYIWEYFKNQGFSDAAVAGILGNIMAEVGGQTLDIQYWLSDSYYCGMCQWSCEYYPDVVGQDLEGQCNFLMATIEDEFNSYGFLSDESYDSFINSTDPQAAAKAFAITYERCSPVSYSQREQNAIAAYDYFCN